MKKLYPIHNSDIKPGDTVEIFNPISDMEKDMVNKYGIKQLTYEGISNPHEYARCRDNTGVIWHIHPESLIYY